MEGVSEIVLNAGRILKERYFESFSYTEKEKYDLVTEIDTEIEEMLISGLKSINPNISFYSEECGKIGEQRNQK